MAEVPPIPEPTGDYERDLRHLLVTQAVVSQVVASLLESTDGLRVDVQALKQSIDDTRIQLLSTGEFADESRKRIIRQRNLIAAGYTLLLVVVIAATVYYSQNETKIACNRSNEIRSDIRAYNVELAKAAQSGSGGTDPAVDDSFRDRINRRFAPIAC